MSSVSRKSPWSVTTAVRVSPAERLTYEAARQMGHRFWLAQPSTIPETLIGRDPDLYVRHIVERWDGAGGRRIACPLLAIWAQGGYS